VGPLYLRLSGYWNLQRFDKFFFWGGGGLYGGYVRLAVTFNQCSVYAWKMSSSAVACISGFWVFATHLHRGSAPGPCWGNYPQTPVPTLPPNPGYPTVICYRLRLVQICVRRKIQSRVLRRLVLAVNMVSDRTAN